MNQVCLALVDDLLDRLLVVDDRDVLFGLDFRGQVVPLGAEEQLLVLLGGFDQMGVSGNPFDALVVFGHLAFDKLVQLVGPGRFFLLWCYAWVKRVFEVLPMGLLLFVSVREVDGVQGGVGLVEGVEFGLVLLGGAEGGLAFALEDFLDLLEGLAGIGAQALHPRWLPRRLLCLLLIFVWFFVLLEGKYLLEGELLFILLLRVLLAFLEEELIATFEEGVA